MAQVIRHFERPPADLVSAFKRLTTPILSVVMGRGGAMDNGIEPITANMQLAATGAYGEGLSGRQSDLTCGRKTGQSAGTPGSGCWRLAGRSPLR